MSNSNIEATTAITPLTETELNAFRSIFGSSSQNETIIALTKTFTKAVNEITNRYDYLINDTQTKYLEMTSKLNDAITALAESNALIAETIKSSSSSVLQKTAHSVEINSNTDDLFITKLSEEESISWRKNARSRIEAVMNRLRLDYGDCYRMIYESIKNNYNINLLNLYDTCRGKYPSRLNMISHSDKLMEYFDHEVNSLIPVMEKKRSTKYVSAHMICPENIKREIIRYFNKENLADYDYAKFYNAFNKYRNVGEIVSAAKKKTGFKNINKGYAIAMDPNGYEDVVRFVNAFAN